MKQDEKTRIALINKSELFVFEPIWYSFKRNVFEYKEDLSVEFQSTILPLNIGDIVVISSEIQVAVFDQFAITRLKVDLKAKEMIVEAVRTGVSSARTRIVCPECKEYDFVSALSSCENCGRDFYQLTK